jgi:hypothetical protein
MRNTNDNGVSGELSWYDELFRRALLHTADPEVARRAAKLAMETVPDREAEQRLHQLAEITAKELSLEEVNREAELLRRMEQREERFVSALERVADALERPLPAPVVHVEAPTRSEEGG